MRHGRDSLVWLQRAVFLLTFISCCHGLRGGASRTAFDFVVRGLDGDGHALRQYRGQVCVLTDLFGFMIER